VSFFRELLVAVSQSIEPKSHIAFTNVSDHVQPVCETWSTFTRAFVKDFVDRFHLQVLLPFVSFSEVSQHVELLASHAQHIWNDDWAVLRAIWFCLPFLWGLFTRTVRFCFELFQWSSSLTRLFAVQVFFALLIGDYSRPVRKLLSKLREYSQLLLWLWTLFCVVPWASFVVSDLLSHWNKIELLSRSSVMKQHEIVLWVWRTFVRLFAYVKNLIRKP
jgi:hypothetical protein